MKYYKNILKITNNFNVYQQVRGYIHFSNTKLDTYKIRIPSNS